MDKSLDSFWAIARNVSLSPTEKASCLEGIQQGMTFVHATEGVVLNPLEKDAARDAIVTFMRLHPVSQEAEERRSWADLIDIFRMPLRFSLSSALVLVLLLGTGGVYAAESALPGDFLYPVKVDVIEPIRESFLVTPESRSSWAIYRVERRLEEAKMLAERGRLTPDRRAVLEKRIVEHVTRVEEEEGVSTASSMVLDTEEKDRRDILSEKIESFHSALQQEHPKTVEANEELEQVVHFLEEVHRNVQEKKRKDREALEDERRVPAAASNRAHASSSARGEENASSVSSDFPIPPLPIPPILSTHSSSKERKAHSRSSDSSSASSHGIQEEDTEEPEDVPLPPITDDPLKEPKIPRGGVKDLL